VTGSDTTKRGIFVCYDIFGLYIQSIRGADILASDYAPQPDEAGDFKVFMPVFFGDHPADIANYPPKTPPQQKAIMDFMTGPANPAKTLPLILPLLDAMKKENPQIESWAILGYCWGGKISALVSQEGSPFKASGQCHPSLLETVDATKIVIPHVVLPSMDEVPEVRYSRFQKLDPTNMTST
jgi:dienelactone hydrolase